MKLRGLLADINVQGHVTWLARLSNWREVWPILSQLGLQLATFPDLNLDRRLDDRTLWNFCQKNGWVLFTENRNNTCVDSLNSTMSDSWKTGELPVLTLANKGRFQHYPVCANQVAADLADLLFGICDAEFTDQARIYLPRQVSTHLD